jgi:hypothetical protein
MPYFENRGEPLSDAQMVEAGQRRPKGATLAEPARSYNVSQATISRLTA